MTATPENRFRQFPRDLAQRARALRLGQDVPTLLAHPDWSSPTPVVLWMHGRTAQKEIDPGRFLRWVRNGIAVCAIDLPGHGERFDERLQAPEAALDVMAQALAEIDAVVAGLGDKEFRGAFDLSRAGIGGMSLGGMAALRRLCDPHSFRAACVEGTTGWLDGLYNAAEHGLPVANRWMVRHDPAKIAELDPAGHLEDFRPIPLLAAHSESDQMVPFAGQRDFLDSLREHYRSVGAGTIMVELLSWPETGAPQEHVGFGRFSNDAKNAQVEFLARHLGRGGDKKEE